MSRRHTVRDGLENQIWLMARWNWTGYTHAEMIAARNSVATGRALAFRLD